MRMCPHHLRICGVGIEHRRVSRFTPRRIFLPRLVEMPRLPDVIRLQDVGRRAKSNEFSCEEQRLREMLPYQLLVMENGQNSPPLSNPGLDHRQKIGHGALVDGVEWFIQQDQLRILQHGARKQGALQLAAGE